MLRQRSAVVFACPLRPAGTILGGAMHHVGSGRRADRVPCGERADYAAHDAVERIDEGERRWRISAHGGGARAAAALAVAAHARAMRPTHGHPARCASSAPDVACVLCRDRTLCVHVLCRR